MSGAARGWLGAAIAMLGVAGRVAGQGAERGIERAVSRYDPAARLRVDTGLGLAERSEFEVGGFASFTFLHLTDSDANARDLLQPEITLYGRAVVDGAHLFFGRARFQYRDFSEGDSFDGRGDRWTEPFLDRYWYEFDLKRAAAAYRGVTLGGDLNLRVGRQFVDWAAGLVLSENLYAFRPRVEVGRWSLDGLAGVTPGDESVIDFDASRAGYNDDTARGYFGARLAYRTPGGNELYVYGLAQQDYSSGGGTRVPLPLDVDFKYNSEYLGVGSSGSLTSSLVYVGEFVYELGHSQSDPLRGAQQREGISAWAARGQLTWLPSGSGNARVELEGLFASGDRDRLVTTDTVGGNLPGSQDHAFNSLGFVNTGLAFAPAFSNLMTFRAGAAAFPFQDQAGFEKLQLGIDLLVFNKMDSQAPIDEPTGGDRFLGLEADFSLSYRATSDLSLSARYGAFFPGASIETETDVRHFVFLSVTLAF